MEELDDALRLAETLCARICHDLAGSVGTLAGMVEMLHETVPAGDETLAVAAASASALQQRLELLRAAWGANPGPLSLEEIRRLAGGLANAHRLVLDLDGVPAGSVFPPEIGRAVLAVLMLAAASLPGIGRIALSGTPEDVVFVIEGVRSAWPAELTACLHDRTALLAAFDHPRGLALPLAILLARRAGLRLSLLLGTGQPDDLPPPLRLASGG